MAWKEKLKIIKEQTNYIKALGDKLNDTNGDMEVYREITSIQLRLHNLCADIQTVILNSNKPN